jgi:hypothetical protein
MRARSTSVHGRTVGEPRSLLAEFAGMDAGKPRTRGGLFFGYFLLDKQKKGDIVLPVPKRYDPGALE